MWTSKKDIFQNICIYNSERQVNRNNYITGKFGGEVNLVICTAHWYCIYYYVHITMKSHLRNCLFSQLQPHFYEVYDHISVHFTDIKWTCDVINKMYGHYTDGLK